MPALTRFSVTLSLWIALWRATGFAVAIVALGSAAPSASQDPMMAAIVPETLTCGALAAAMARFDAAHPATPRSESPEYRALIAAVEAKLGVAHATREIAAAIDDALIDGAATPDAPFLPVLARHRVIADRWRE